MLYIILSTVIYFCHYIYALKFMDEFYPMHICKLDAGYG